MLGQFISVLLITARSKYYSVLANNKLIVALLCSEKFNKWKTNFAVNYFGLPNIVNLIKICAIFQLPINQETSLFNCKQTNNRALFPAKLPRLPTFVHESHTGNLHLSSCFFYSKRLPTYSIKSNYKNKLRRNDPKLGNTGYSTHAFVQHLNFSFPKERACNQTLYASEVN